MSIALDSDRIASLLVWDNGQAIDYSEEDIVKHGLTTTYEVICDNHASRCTVEIFNEDNKHIGCTDVGEVRRFLRGLPYVVDWQSIWEKGETNYKDMSYRLMWSNEGLGEDEMFGDLNALRTSFRAECKQRLIRYKTKTASAVVPVIPDNRYKEYVEKVWTDYDQCCWVNHAWANDYSDLPVGPYYSDLNGYARNITSAGRLGRTMVKFT